MVTYNGNSWSTMQAFSEWLVIDKCLQPDILFEWRWDRKPHEHTQLRPDPIA